MINDENQGPIRFGIVGPGERAVHWARVLSSIGADAWFHSPKGSDLSRILDLELKVEPKIQLPYLGGGYTNVLIAAGPWSEERDEHILHAIEQGVHVIVEPPFTITAEDAQMFRYKASENDVGLMTAFRPLHTSAYRQMSHWANKSIGKIQYIDIMWAETDTYLDPLWDIMSVPMSMLYGMDRGTPEKFRVSAGPGWISVHYMGPSDMRVTAISGAASPEHCVRILGETGSIECYPYKEECYLRKYDGDVIQDISCGAGSDRAMLLFFCRRIQEYRREGKEMPFGEIGCVVSEILSQVDDALDAPAE